MTFRNSSNINLIDLCFLLAEAELSFKQNAAWIEHHCAEHGAPSVAIYERHAEEARQFINDIHKLIKLGGSL